MLTYADMWVETSAQPLEEYLWVALKKKILCKWVETSAQPLEEYV
jgi:hypothetical protein